MTTPVRLPPGSGQLRLQFLDRVGQTYPLYFCGSLLLSSLLAVGLWAHLPHGRLLLWLVTVGIAQTAHAAYSRCYLQRRRLEMVDPRPWLYGFWVGAAVTGFCWSLPFYLFKALPQDALLLLIMVVVGVTAYGGMGRSSVLSVALMFEFATLLPVSLWLLWQAGAIHRTMGIASLLYLVMIVPLLYRMNQTANHLLVLNDENHRLGAAQKAYLEKLQRSEEESRNERAALRAFFEALPAAAWMKDPEGRYLVCNRALEQLYGTPEATIVGKTDVDFVGPERAADFHRGDSEAISSGRACVSEAWCCSATDGRRVLLEVVKSPVFGADSKVIGVIGVAHDITLRKQAEQALQDRGDLLNAIMDSSPDVIVFALDRDYRYISFNARHRQTMQALWGQDIAVGMNMLDVVGTHPDREIAKRGFDRALAGESYVDENAYGNEALAREHWQTFWSPIRNSTGEVTGLTCFVLNVSKRRRAEESLRLSERLMRTVIDATPDWIFVKDQEHRYQLVNKAYADALHMPPDAIIGKNGLELGMPEDQVKGNPAKGIRGFWEDDQKVLESNNAQIYADHPVTVNGEQRTFHTIKIPLRDNEGLPWGVLAVAHDITERKQMEQALEAREQEFRTLVENAVDTVVRYGTHMRRLYVNPAFAALFPGGASVLLGRTPTENHGGPNAAAYEAKLTEVINHGQRCEFELNWTDAKGRETCTQINLTPEFDAQGQVCSVLAVGRDITELNAYRQKIHQMAFYDPLTTLPNRALFNDRLQQMISDSAWRGQQAGLMMMDMDRFKEVNDTLGHAAGDELLRETAARLSTCLRVYDTVARLGGDEFAFLLPDVRSGEDLGRIATKILAVFQQPFVLAGKEVFVSCSMGIALYPDDSQEGNDLLKYADSAMYFAKRSGRNNFRFYSRDLTESAHDRLELESDLRRAVERKELELFYQPKVRLSDGSLIGSEALLRWHHPQRGMLPPSMFIAIAEDSGLIVDLGQWVLMEACRAAAQWNGLGRPLHQVAINLSARQFQGGDLVARVSRALEASGCRAEWIELEITESLLLDDEHGVLNVLNSLTALGVSIAIDDFGTGYSALSYLARFPIGTLKIDRSFINHVTTDKYRAELVKAILSIARCLGQNVVAEGVETQAQADFLLAHGCVVAQGYLYGKPMPMHELDQTLAHHPVAHRTSPAQHVQPCAAPCASAQVCRGIHAWGCVETSG